MTWIELGNPALRDTPGVYTPFAWPEGNLERLPTPSLANQSFAHVVGARRSERTFGPLADRDLAALMWLSCHALTSWHSDLGFPLSMRPSPSAGAIHGIHVLLGKMGSPDWKRYDPFHHTLMTIPGMAPTHAGPRTDVSEVLSAGEGTILQFVAEPGKVAAKYANPSSLIWRDAGALIAHLGLAASYLGLHFCALGIDGNAWSSMLDPERRLAGVGVALVGSPI